MVSRITIKYKKSSPRFILKFGQPTPRFIIKYKKPSPKFILRFKEPTPTEDATYRTPAGSNTPEVVCHLDPPASDLEVPANDPVAPANVPEIGDSSFGTAILCHTPVTNLPPSRLEGIEPWSLDPTLLTLHLHHVQLAKFFDRAIKECDMHLPRSADLDAALRSYFWTVCGVDLELDECEKERKKFWRIAVRHEHWRRTGDELLKTEYS